MLFKILRFMFILIASIFISCQVVYGDKPVVVYQSEDNYPPYKFSQNGKFNGFEIELSNIIFADGDYNVEFSTDSWSRVYDGVANDKIDTCGLVAINEERKRELLFSNVVLKGYISIYTRSDFNIVSVKDLEQYHVGVGYKQYTEEILHDVVGIKNYSTFSTVEEALEALDKGTIDVLFENQEAVNYYLIEKELKTRIKSQESNLYPVQLAYGVRKGNKDLVKYVNKKLEYLISTGEYENLYQKYFGAHSEYYDNYHRNKFIFITVLIIIIFILLQVHIKRLKKKITRAYRELRKHHEWLEVTISSIGEAIIATDEKGVIMFTNLEAQKMFSLSEDEFMKKCLNEVLGGLMDENGAPCSFSVEEVINRGVKLNLESISVLASTDGNEHLVTGAILPIRNELGEIIGTVSAIKDITEIKRSEKRIYDMEYYDSLTGLPNKALFSDRLNMALANARRSGLKCAIIILDLDNFKTINDTLGHACGDEILKQMGEKIKGYIREVDTVARFAGDEFIILQPNVRLLTDITRAVERIIEKFQKPWILEGREYYVTASIGIAVYPNDGEDEQTLIRNADIAMYKAKETGKNSYEMFMESMNKNIIDKLDMENSLRHALEKEEFVLFYQPQIDIKTGNIIGVEALIRWNREGIGLVPPMEFIPMIEESGLIIPLGEWVLRAACMQNVEWIRKGIKPVLIAVNLSAKQFQQQNLVKIIENVLNETGLDPKLLELEITESIAMQDIDFTIAVLKELREKGIRISLDDFGTGYSSLNYLKMLPIDTLKIDKSFVRDITSNSNEEAIAKSVISLAHKMHLSVVAEGVETKEQLEFLKEHMCDKVQGFLLSKPLQANEAEILLRKM